MKKTLLFTSLLSVLIVTLSAQGQAETYIKEAQDYLAQKNYTQAQLSLQDAINEINNAIAAQITEALPNEINGLTSDPGETNTAGMGMMGGGMSITKSYHHPSKSGNEAEVQILANSPMLSAMNMYINNPAIMGQDYKSVRVGTRRSILKSEMQDHYDDNGKSMQIRSTELQIPLSQTLITINLQGFASEADELAFAAKLDIDKLKTLLGE
jgi:hypothetical protein